MRYLFLSLFLLSCATNGIYNILYTSQQTYDAVFTSLGEMYREGVITEQQKETAIKYGDEYKKVHNQVVNQLIAYESGKSDEKPDIVALSQQLANLLHYARSIGYGQ